MYKPLEITKCEKCGKVIAEPKELIRIVKGRKKR
jgi:ribosomal protein S27E